MPPSPTAIRDTLTATISSGQTVSDAQNIGGMTICGLIIPAALTGTILSFLVSLDNATWVPLYDATNTQMTMTVGASRGYTVDPSALAPWGFVQVVSNTAEAASRAIQLAVRGL